MKMVIHYFDAGNSKSKDNLIGYEWSSIFGAYV